MDAPMAVTLVDALANKVGYVAPGSFPDNGPLDSRRDEVITVFPWFDEARFYQALSVALRGAH